MNQGAFDQPDGMSYWQEPTVGYTDVKRPHYVPQMWLKRFADESGQVRAHDQATGREFRTDPKNVGAIGRYYDVPLGDKTLSIEPWFAEVESEANPILAALIESPDHLLALGLEDQHRLARYFAATYFRPPAYRAEMNAMMRDIASQVNAAYPDADVPFVPEEADAAHVAWMLEKTPGWGNMLMAPPWRIGRTTGERRVYLSDNPMSRWVEPVHKYVEAGPTIHSYVYWIPLAPNTILRIDGSDSESFADTNDFQPVREVRDFNPWEVSICRHVVTANASQYLYGEGPFVTRSCAHSCLQRIDLMKRIVALRLGFDPGDPSMVLAEQAWADEVKDVLAKMPWLDPLWNQER